MGSGYEPDAIRSAVEGSLRRIRRDVIDLYPLHQAVPDVDIEAAWDAMAGLADDGLLRFGLSNVEPEQIELCQRIRPVDSLQPNLSMLYRNLQALIAWCDERASA